MPYTRGEGVTTDQHVSLSVVVMAHPRRDKAARRLQEQYPELGITVVYDPDPDGPPATLRTARLAWAAVADGATHHLVLQDDVELCAGFPEVVRRATAVGPPGPLAFFANWASRSGQLLRLAALSGATWAPVLDAYVPTQALLLPAPLAREFAAYLDGLPFTVPDNQAVSFFLASRGLTTHVCCPNLVEHVGTESLLWHDVMFGVRRSVLFPAGEGLASHRFDGTVVGSGCVPHFESLAGYAVVYFQEARDGRPAQSIAAHEVLIDCGMSNLDIVEQYRGDLRENPEAEPDTSGFGYPFTFQLWLTSFVFGAVAGELLDGPDPEVLAMALRRPWARPALHSLPAGTLRRFVPMDRLADTSERLRGLCDGGIRSGFLAAARWPQLSTISSRVREVAASG